MKVYWLVYITDIKNKFKENQTCNKIGTRENID